MDIIPCQPLSATPGLSRRVTYTPAHVFSRPIMLQSLQHGAEPTNELHSPNTAGAFTLVKLFASLCELRHLIDDSGLDT